MSDAISVSGPINAAGLEMTLETGKLASLAAGAVVVKVGGTTLLSTVATSKPREGIDFFPLTVDVEERAYAAGKIPGSFFRREGRPGEHAILTCRLTDRPLRPSFPADFRNEVQVIATILGVDLENPHDVAVDQRRVGRAHRLGHPVRRPDRRGAPRAPQRRVDRAPHVPRGRRLDVRDRRRRPSARRRRRRDHDGRGRRHRAHVGALRRGRPEDDRRAHRRGPRGVEAVDRRFDRAAEEAARGVRRGARPDHADRVHAERRLHARGVRGGEGARGGRRPTRRWRSPTRPTATTKLDEIHGGIAGRAGRHRRQARRPTPSRPARSRRPSARCRRKSSAGASSTKACASTVAAPPTSGRCRPRSACSTTAHGSSLFQRGETQVLDVATLGMPRMEQMLDTITLETASATCTTTTSRRSPPARPAASVRRSAARSVTARSPSGRWSRCCRARHEWPYTMRVVSDVLVVERLHVDGVGLRLDAVADGRGCADQGAGRRHRDGPRVRRGQVHDAHRHPRRRGRVRRHGLQGRRHGRVRHRAAARHEDRRHPRRRARRRRCSRPRKPA